MFKLMKLLIYSCMCSPHWLQSSQHICLARIARRSLIGVMCLFILDAMYTKDLDLLNHLDPSTNYYEWIRPRSSDINRKII